MGENKTSSLGHGPAEDQGSKAGTEVLVNVVFVNQNIHICRQFEITPNTVKCFYLFMPPKGGI